MILHNDILINNNSSPDFPIAMSMKENSALLEWNGYKGTSQTAFHSLFDDVDFTDVTLACDGDGSALQAHKVVLSSCSTLFSKILRQNPNPHPLIYLQGVNTLELQLLKRFMYLGRTRVNLDQFESFLEISKRFLNQPTQQTGVVAPKTEEPTEQKTVAPCPNGNEYVENPLSKVGPPESLGRPTKFRALPLSPIDKKIVPPSPNRVKTFENATKMSHEIRPAGKRGRPRKAPTLPLEYSCLQCSFKSTRKRHLRKHRRENHPRPKEDFPCPEVDCGFISKLKGSLQKHSSSHSDGKKYLCDECEYSTPWVGSFRDHKRKHSGDLLYCQQCEFTTTSTRSIEKHKESVHGEAKYLCEMCDYKSSSKRTLKRHSERVHEGIRFVCELCSHQATSTFNLKSHMRRVHEKSSFKCSVCDYNDSEKSRLVLHIKREHNEEAEIVPNWYLLYWLIVRIQNIYIWTLDTFFLDASCRESTRSTYRATLKWFRCGTIPSSSNLSRASLTCLC